MDIKNNIQAAEMKYITFKGGVYGKLNIWKIQERIHVFSLTEK